MDIDCQPCTNDTRTYKLSLVPASSLDQFYTDLGIIYTRINLEATFGHLPIMVLLQAPNPKP